ncbi:MAG: hydantoinase B/oxoprolinase family protein [Sphingomonadales bacterium]|nr:hydantoinase B/oxoprolinase family protein [Sphingomonadales bacterium]
MEHSKIGIDWNGRTHSYRPKADWRDRIDKRLRLHTGAADDLDPVTFEVLRQKLWTINIAHGDTITRISGSPLLASLDFNMSILTEDAEVVLNAPYVQFLNAGAPLGIRYIMETYSGGPGIDEGDIYVCNDPWIGACHQMDVLFAAPIFVDGQLFGWVANAGHQYDLGGVVPGGWPQNAEDVYYDPIVLPPFKMVEKGELRRDLEALYLRQSRMPDLVALDLRAQIAGVTFARDQIIALTRRYGMDTVKAAMRRMLDQAQESFRQKLAKLPDGTWSEVRYLDEALPGDRTTQRTQLNVTKRGDRITVDNIGTDAQTPGTNGIPFTSWSGSITGIISISMLYQQLFAYGGSERQIDYQPTPGLLTCVDHPTAVSGGIMQVIPMMNVIQAVLSRMMACDPELRADLLAPCSDYMLPVLIGYDDRGNYFGQAILDAFGGGSGARSFGDGIDSSGPSYSPLSMILNVELIEQWYPLLFLYRKEDADSGGAGQWRGGGGVRSAITPYRAQSMTVVTNTSGQCVSAQNSPGLFGGLPSPAGHYLVRYGTDLPAWMRDGRVPAGIEDLAAERTEPLRAKSNGAPLGNGDVMEIRVGGGGGYGDPLDREPARVARDVALGYATRQAASSVYGVALTAAGQPDVAQTAALRETLRNARAAWRPTGIPDDSAPVAATGAPPRLVHATIASVDRDGERILACDRCGHRYCGHGGNYKAAALMEESPVTAIPSAADPAFYVDEKLVLRQFCCPGCHVQVCTEVAKADEPVEAEMRLS